MHIRPLLPHEASVFREVRLRALAESPDAFGETLQQAQAQPDSYWETLTDSVTRPDGHVMVLAEQAEQIMGFVCGLLDRYDEHIGHLGGMWVDPAFRSSGVGHLLVASILEWAHQRNHRKLQLWVTEGNLKAIRLYEKMGFVDTGKRDELPSDRSLQIVQMALEL